MSNLDDLSPATRALLHSTELLVTQYPDTVVYGTPEDGDYDHRCVMVSLLTAQICTRLTPQAAADWYSTVRPPGTSHNRWDVDEDVEPVVCDEFPATHRHVFVIC